MPEHQMGAIEYWNQLHHKYASTDWIARPSLFADWVITYFPKGSSILDLGAGQGQDSRFFAQRGHAVTMVDFSDVALAYAKKQLAEGVQERVTIVKHDLTEPLPFPDSSFDVVYSHQSLHYFTIKKTQEIFHEIQRVLKPHGLLAMLTNSIHDPEYKSGPVIEPDFFNINGITKRFFSPETLLEFAKDFEIMVCDDLGETFKDRVQHPGRASNLIRFVGSKK